MSLRTRLAGLVAAAAVAVSGVAVITQPAATAAPLARPVAVVDATAAKAAADWLAAQPGLTGGVAADAAIGLAAEGTHVDRAKALVDALAAEVKATPADAYATSNGGAAAKTAIAALAVASDPTSFGGADLYDTIYKSADTASYPYTDALMSIALSRGGRAIPTALAERLASQATYDTLVGFGDLDSAAVVVSALSAMNDPSAADARARLTEWLASQQRPDGSWPGYSPVNTTALVGGAWFDLGRAADLTTTTTFMKGQQQLTGTGAFPSTLGGTDSNLMATTQGLMYLSGVSYLSAPAHAPFTPLPPATSPTGSATTSTPPPVLNERVACAEQGGVWTVIQVHHTVTKRGCVMQPATALAAFQSIATVQTKDTSYGPMVCSVDGLPACDAPFTGEFWSFYTSAPNQPWAFANEGVGTLSPAAGTYLALIWTADEVPAKVIAGDAPVPAPVNNSGSSSTPAPSAAPGLAHTGN